MQGIKQTNRVHTTPICARELYRVEQSPYCDPLTLLPSAIEFTVGGRVLCIPGMGDPSGDPFRDPRSPGKGLNANDGSRRELTLPRLSIPGLAYWGAASPTQREINQGASGCERGRESLAREQTLSRISTTHGRVESDISLPCVLRGRKQVPER